VAHAAGPECIETQRVVVCYDKDLRPAADKLIEIYPEVTAELEATLRWKVDYRPVVYLVEDRRVFTRMAGSRFYVAYAVPAKNLVVIDYSHMNIHPFTLRVTLKHELCHLLLHRHINKAHLPKWLDEGVAQWSSEGIGEIIVGKRRSRLTWARLSGRLISLGALSHEFPRDEDSLILAYEQSKDIVEYINKDFGRNSLLNLLNAVKNGNEINDAMLISLAMPVSEFESRWRKHVKIFSALFAYIAGNIYSILFFLSALLTVFAYIRLLIKKRRRMLEYEEEEVDTYQ